MIFEFMGIPGSGKTTIHGSVMAELHAAGHAVSLPRDMRVGTRRIGGKIGRIFGYVGIVFNRRRIIWISFRILLKSSRPRSHKLDALKRLIVTFLRYKTARRVDDGIILFDEGFAQRCFMILVDRPSGFDLGDAIRFVDNGQWVGTLIHVDYEPESAISRLEGRDRGLPPRFEALTKTDQVKVLASGRDLFRLIEERATGANGERVRVIKKNGDDSGAARAIAKAIISVYVKDTR